MESLSRPFHSRKLSNAATFSNKNPYDGVLSGHRRKFAGPSPTNFQDYREIFGSSQPSSIPVLDLSTLREPSDDLSSNFRSSNPDYSKIFGGFLGEEDVAVSYEELFGCDKVRATRQTSQDSDDLCHQSPDGLKQFSMSYNKINQKSKDGLDGTNFVTQIPAATGFTCFIDEPVMEAEKQNPQKQPSRKAVELIFDDKKSKTFDVDFKIHPSTVSSSPTHVVNRKSNPRRSVNSESRRRDFDEGIDVKSAAYDSSAALKKAIEKAQESIRIAKESVGRKEKGLRSFSNKKFKNRSKVEGSMEGVTECGDKRCREENSSQNFQDVGGNHEYGEKLLVAKKFIDEIHEKISESNKDRKFGDNMVVYNAAKVTSETESKPLDSAGKDKYATLSSEAVETETIKIQISDFVHEDQADNMFVDEHEAEIHVGKPTIDILEDESVVKELESVENNDEVRLSHAHELVKELSNLNVSQNDNEGVLEYEDSKNAESEKHEETEEAFEQVKSENESKHEQNSEVQKEVETGEMFERNAKDSVQTCDHKLEETEVNLDDSYEIKHEDNPTVERDQDFDEKSSGDNKDMEETDDISCMHVESKIVEMNDIHMETTQEVDEVTEISREFQAEEADFCARTYTDQTASDDNEDEYDQSDIIDNLADLGSENDIQSESSSGSTHDSKIIGEESNIQPSRKEMPDNESISEIKDSQEPESRHKEDEIEEPGPSKVSGKERFRRIVEETAAKEREWENNKLAVERAIREARERAFAEARERAERERAAVEKATQEVRQRMMAEAHEKVSKASVTNTSSSEKASAQSKLRAERAAVERATSEARQRALEKAISQKTVSDLNHSESALRTKAKLEKHNRIMERAAKALAEKEKRDRLAQKEQAERNRLAENLDADIKRWSNGKEKNLRALLSTLQYILGPESGWQPVSLTEMITTSAVKKAYRKATLCVHPDKLQQRGATVQHKYICEKVFDLLKAAWNRFNSEER